jgi:hypothetical protein
MVQVKVSDAVNPRVRRHCEDMPSSSTLADVIAQLGLKSGTRLENADHKVLNTSLGIADLAWNDGVVRLWSLHPSDLHGVWRMEAQGDPWNDNNNGGRNSTCSFSDTLFLRPDGTCKRLTLHKRVDFCRPIYTTVVYRYSWRTEGTGTWSLQDEGLRIALDVETSITRVLPNGSPIVETEETKHEEKTIGWEWFFNNFVATSEFREWFRYESLQGLLSSRHNFF